MYCCTPVYQSASGHQCHRVINCTFCASPEFAFTAGRNGSITCNQLRRGSSPSDLDIRLRAATSPGWHNQTVYVVYLSVCATSVDRVELQGFAGKDCVSAAGSGGYASVVQEGLPKESVAALDRIEESLSKFDDGPFFLGQFSLVDIAYAPFVDGFQVFFAGIQYYDTTAGRPNIRRFIEEMDGIAAYAKTKQDPQELLALTRKKFGI